MQKFKLKLKKKKLLFYHEIDIRVHIEFFFWNSTFLVSFTLTHIYIIDIVFIDVCTRYIV